MQITYQLRSTANFGISAVVIVKISSVILRSSPEAERAMVSVKSGKVVLIIFRGIDIKIS